MAQTVGEALLPALQRILDIDARERAQDLEVINEWRGIYPHNDDGILAHVIRKLGIEGAFTDEALLVMADEYRRMERQRQRTREHNRRIYEAQS
ncbi:hypothetical protein [Microvirga sp. G4-2]|uniref:hypothetical protein n=1 Tax=Microvirga sp. G4-2 TaxID=3434467 RepID=UPI0040450C4B